jgi:ribosomal-protein-alanine N-acetyltransferase
VPRDFRTPRLTARPVTLEDFALLDALHRDPRVMAMLGGILSAERTRERLAAFVKQWETHDHGLWILDDAAGHVGYSGFVPVEEAGEMELVCAFSPARWGAGYGTEVVRSLTRIGLHDLRLESVLGRLVAESISTWRITNRLGYRNDGFHAPRLHLRYTPPPLRLEGARPPQVLREAYRADAPLLHALLSGGTDLDDVDAIYHRRGGCFDVVQSGERLVGSVALWPLDDDVCAVRRLGVTPGELALLPGLVAHAIRMGRELGFLRSVIDLQPLPREAREACEQHGFVPLAPAERPLPDATHVLPIMPPRQ